MPITDPNAVAQALANISLEALTIPEDVLALIQRALTDKTIDTDYILNYLRG